MRFWGVVVFLQGFARGQPAQQLAHVLRQLGESALVGRQRFLRARRPGGKQENEKQPTRHAGSVTVVERELLGDGRSSHGGLP